VAKFVPTANNGSAELIRIHKEKAKNSSGLVIWCLFQKLKYVWNEELGEFRGLEFPTSRTYKHYLDHTGEK
jgi:cation-transporting ATPase 13A1